jgi:hypothetical protein
VVDRGLELYILIVWANNGPPSREAGVGLTARHGGREARIDRMRQISWRAKGDSP